MLLRHGLNRLPQNAKKRTLLTTRYEKQVPGPHLQVDGKFLDLPTPIGKTVRRFSYPAVDDATRVRALQIYEKHTQAHAIAFLYDVGARFPFRIHTVRTDHGHEFQAKFHGHVEDLGMIHPYTNPRTPGLAGKLERSPKTDQTEFAQLLTYTNLHSAEYF